jgi:hypothetical protein
MEGLRAQLDNQVDVVEGYYRDILTLDRAIGEARLSLQAGMGKVPCDKGQPSYRPYCSGSSAPSNLPGKRGAVTARRTAYWLQSLSTLC